MIKIPLNNIKTHLFSYSYEGSEYSLEIPANSVQEAKERLSRMTFARYDGELVTVIPALPTTGMFVRLYTWTRNRLLNK